MRLWKYLLLGIALYIIIALPAFYIISGEVTQDMLWKSSLSFLIAILVSYFFIYKKRG